MAKFVSEYKVGDRIAHVFQYSDGGHFVKLMQPGRLEEFRDLRGKSEHYAEDLAENFVNRVGEFA